MVAAELDVDPPPDDVVIEREARGADRLQHRVAQPLAVIELVRVRRLEEQAAQVDELHQHAVARLDRVIVDMARIRKMMPAGALALDRLPVAAQGR